MGRIEDKILDILIQPELNEEVSYEVVGGPTPSATLKGPLDYKERTEGTRTASVADSGRRRDRQ